MKVVSLSWWRTGGPSRRCYYWTQWSRMALETGTVFIVLIYK